MVKIGMTINDRYEIIEKIGTGGMSDVYKALDTKLNRNVAIKVLKAEFGENENFVSKFRVEAQAAAGLMHSNIVNVYDVGEENDIHYIVMELVEGITLKKYIEKKARLTYKEAVSIAIQVSLGIEAAHSNHIIHRDIKPQNIIISRDGKVKVTDFGIAKAATSNTITSNVMGSVHYTSPEQARGGYSDEKSDIYSLGITMFEMLTGRVPFNGDTTVAIAIKHIQEAMPSPREYVPEIPQCVESIIYKCCEKSPDRRYQSMGELITDLKQALLTPDVDFVVRDDQDILSGTRTVSDEDMAKIKNSQTGKIVESIDEHLMKLAPGSDTYAQGNTSNEYYENEQPQSEDGYTGNYEEYSGEGYAQEGYEQPYDENYTEENYDDQYPAEGYDEGNYDDTYGRESGLENEEDYNPKMEKITTIIAIAAGVVIVGIIVALAITIISKMNNTSKVPNQDSTENVSPVIEEDDGVIIGEEDTTVVLPAMIGKEIDTIRNELFALGVSIDPRYEESETVEAGYIIEAKDSEGNILGEGSEIKKSETVILKVSSGVSGIEIPAVAGVTYESAVNALTKEGFKVSKVEEFDEEIEEGHVVSVVPESGTTVPKGSTVQIIVSKGPETTNIKVPNLVGLTTEDALARLLETGLLIGSQTTAASDTIEKDKICQQSVAAGEYVEKGTPINVTISLGAAGVSYRYDAYIPGPTAEEAPGYIAGTPVKIVVADATGKVFIEATETDFPYNGGVFYGLSTSGGTITMYYDAKTDPVIQKDENGNDVVVSEGTVETRSFTRSETFTQE